MSPSRRLPGLIGVLALAASLLQACGSDEPSTELQLLSSCHLPAMADYASPIFNWPQLAGDQRSCSLVVRNVGQAPSKGTAFRFVDSSQIRFLRLQNCSTTDIVACPSVTSGTGALPDIPPGGQYTLDVLLETSGTFNGIATTTFEATASNESTGRPLSVRIDADLRRADLRWGAVTPTADVVGAEPLVVDALLQNQGPGNLMVSVPRIDAPAGATVLSASFTSPDGLQIVSSFLGRYPYWDGLPSGGSVRVRLSVQLPAGLSGPQVLRLRTPASADPATGNDTVDVPFNVR